MAAKEVTIPGTVVAETARTNFTIVDTPMDGNPPAVRRDISIGYAERIYLVDANGVKTKLVQAGQNPKFIGGIPTTFTDTPITSPAYPEVTTLGELLDAMSDALIQADLAK